MSEIHASVNDQLLKLTVAPTLASGGVNEVKVIFTFTEQWEGFIKTALFYRDTETIYYAVLDNNDTCVLPWEVYAEDGTFYMSLFGDKDGIRRTTTITRYKVGKGIVAEDMLPSDPTPDVYAQIMEMIAAGGFGGGSGEKGEKGEKGDKGDAGVGIVNITISRDGDLLISLSDDTNYNLGKIVGSDGRTPVRGVDYWTDEDKAEIKSYVDEAILGGEW